MPHVPRLRLPTLSPASTIPSSATSSSPMMRERAYSSAPYGVQYVVNEGNESRVGSYAQSRSIFDGDLSDELVQSRLSQRCLLVK